MLTTERLIIRRFKKSDLNDLYEYSKSPSVGPSAGWEYHRSKQESLRMMQHFLKSDEIWAIELKENKKVIGSIGLHRDSKRDNKFAKMIGFVFNQDYWGQGFATEASKRIIEYAFEELELDLVSAYHYPHNRRSKGVILKCGLNYEGVLKRSTEASNGEVYDEACYAITKEEYFTIKK